MYGKPKFKYGEIVRFPLEDTKVEGKIGKVDAYGYELMHDQPYYDIWIGKRGDPNRTYVKHVPENQIERIKRK